MEERVVRGWTPSYTTVTTITRGTTAASSHTSVFTEWWCLNIFMEGFGQDVCDACVGFFSTLNPAECEYFYCRFSHVRFDDVKINKASVDFILYCLSSTFTSLNLCVFFTLLSDMYRTCSLFVQTAALYYSRGWGSIYSYLVFNW